MGPDIPTHTGKLREKISLMTRKRSEDKYLAMFIRVIFLKIRAFPP